MKSSLFRTGRFRYILAWVVTLVFAGASQAGPITIEVYPSLAPNAFGSPNYAGWRTNAIAGLQAGGVSQGSPNSPAYYTTVSSVNASQLIVTNFPSWMGSANPGADFGAAFASELGTRLHFTMRVLGNGTQFSLSQLNYNMSSSDPGNSLGFAGSFGAGDVYSPERVGYIAATNTFVTSGSATQMVDELYYRGIGNAFSVLLSDPGATNQDKLNNGIAGIEQLLPFSVTTSYTITSGPGGTGSVLASGSATVVVTPEPVSFAAWGLVIGGGCFLRRRKTAGRIA